MNSFKVATCTVSLNGYADPIGATQRMLLLSEAVFELSKNEIQLFCLPGGYFNASSNAHLDVLQRQIKDLATNSGIDLFVGLDMKLKNHEPDIEDIKRGLLPAFSFFVSRDGKVSLWRQRTTNSTNQHFVSDNVCQEERLLRATPRVEGLICGEIFNQRIRSGLIDRKTSIVIDQAHKAFRFRVFGPMKQLAMNGISSLCSVHADVREAVKHCYVPGRPGWVSMSSHKTDKNIGKQPRLEIKYWRFDSSGQMNPDVNELGSGSGTF